MSKIRYTPRRKTQRFKEETGLRIGVNRIQEQGRILEESLRTLKNEAKIERMRVDLINKPDYMRATAINAGGRSNTRHPKYF